jgi:hypothetical protein
LELICKPSFSSLFKFGLDMMRRHCQYDCMGCLHPRLCRTVSPDITLVQVSDVTVFRCYIGSGRHYIASVQYDMAHWRCYIAGYPTDATLGRCCVERGVNRCKGPPTQHQPRLTLHRASLTECSTQNRLALLLD